MSVASKLNPYLSDLAVMFMKLHDLHWNVKGMQFVPVHLYTEDRYDDLADNFSVVAMMEEHIACYDKELWFLNATLS